MGLVLNILPAPVDQVSQINPPKLKLLRKDRQFTHNRVTDVSGICKY
jgi:hypothetical protein